MSIKTLLRCIATVLVVVSLAPSMACMGKVQQAAQKQKERNDLMQIGLTYHQYCDSNPKGPATLSDFIKFAQPLNPASVIADLQSGKYVIYLGVDLKKLPDGQANTVLGYEASVPTVSGPVLMADGSTRDMTAAEFAAAPKPPNAKPSQP